MRLKNKLIKRSNNEAKLKNQPIFFSKQMFTGVLQTLSFNKKTSR